MNLFLKNLQKSVFFTVILSTLSACETSQSVGVATTQSPMGVPRVSTSSPPSEPILLGTAPYALPPVPQMMPDPSDDLGLGKFHFREGAYGLAEKHFRLFVEANASNPEGWMGLAAAYDKLKRFDLADRAYSQAIGIAGPRSEILNNRGYSYLMRGDLKRARKDLYAAQQQDPENPLIQQNIALLNVKYSHDTTIKFWEFMHSILNASCPYLLRVSTP
jgi:tetratricopeptide (TPR) repeat protein